jgi:hypothetical protein
VAALPVAAAFTFTAKDYAQETFNVTEERAYDVGLQVIKMAGKVKMENKSSGVIEAEVDGAGVTLKLKKLSEKSTQVTISARKFGFPEVAIASGVMYQLSKQLR